MGQFSFSLSDIKKAMGPSLGLVSNRYLVEIPINIKNQKSLAILARSTSLPESNVGVVDYYYKGRRFKARGEHDFAGTYTLNFTDDSEMKVRELFDTWRLRVDNPTPTEASVLGIFGENSFDILNTVLGGLQLINDVKNMFSFDGGSNFLTNTLTQNAGMPSYQMPVNVWQLSRSQDKVFGYQLTNCFPTEIGAVEIADDNENQLSQFSVTLTYSEFTPIKPSSVVESVVRGALGPTVDEIVRTSQSLFR